MIAPVALGLLAAAVVGATSGEFRLTVLHTNDMHAHFDGTNDGRGGFARLRSALQAERARAVANGAPVIYLDAGDNFHGTDFYEVLRWEPVADLIGDLGVDAMCLGNHEFENGPEELALFLKSKSISSIPIVVANINTEKEPSLSSILRSTVLTVSGHTVGVIGYLTPDTEWLNNVGNVTITDEVSSIKIEAEKLKKSGVDFIIALGHSGLEMDQRIASEVNGIDAVVGGHSHSYLCSGPPQDTESPVGPYPVIVKRDKQIVPVVQAYTSAKYLGKLVLTFDSDKHLISAVGEPILLDQNIPKDAKMSKKVEHYKSLLAERKTKKIVGKTLVYLDGNCSCVETNLCDLIADSFIHFNVNYLLNNKINTTGWTDAAVAITTSSGIKSSINGSETHGEIFFDDIRRTLPYGTLLYKVTIKGSTLLKALEHSASMTNYKNCASPEKKIYGGFMHMSGIHVTYNMKRAVGSRVHSVMIRCSDCKLPSYEPIQLDTQYKIIISKYLTNGGDLYNMFKEEIINEISLNITETDAFNLYVQKMSPIFAEVDNRVKLFN